MTSTHSLKNWYSITQSEFGFTTPEEVRKISVREIDNPQIYNSKKEPNQGGLYDLVLGVSPNDHESVCPTCGKSGLQCSGHPGHIQLVLPTYHPLVIDWLLKFLRMQCFECHRLRIKPLIKQDYRTIFSLIKLGKISQAQDFMSIDIRAQLRKIQRLKDKLKEKESKNKGEDKNEEKEKEIKKNIQNLSKQADLSEKRRQQLIALASNTTQKPQITQTSIQYLNKVLKGFFSLVMNKCPYCNLLSKTVKKEGASKFFIYNKAKQNENFRKKSRDSTSKGGQSTVHGTQMISEDTHKEKKVKKRYMNPKQIQRELKLLWMNQNQLLRIIFGNMFSENAHNMFFLNVLFVPPSRFRPQSKMGEQRYLHDHTNILGKILQCNIDLKVMIANEYVNYWEENEKKPGQKMNKRTKLAEIKVIPSYQFKKASWFSKTLKKIKTKTDFINKWLQLQDYVNGFMDSTRSSKANDVKGIRQILQKKEGLFRMKMMGKRVNYAARSVISPDPSLNTDQVGVPIFMAKKLTIPEYVNEANLQKLQSYIINGKNYPGATILEQNGVMTKIDHLSPQQRIALARNLLINFQKKIVYRNLMTGDNVLFNRQPTLHKPGLMAHRVKVLPKQSTLRMNYANCKSYNADFDGDEMNLHAIQNYMAKAQAQLCISDQMFNNPTNGKPIRQIMQDSIISAVYLTMKDTFLNKKDYMELLYQSTFSLLENLPKNSRLLLFTPAIIKPRQLWTGKQLFSNVITMIINLSDSKIKNCKGLTMKSKTKVNASYLKGCEEQTEVVLINNELLQGIIDKNQLGSGSQFGLAHSFNQLYGEKMTGKLLTCLNKLFLNYMQMHGFTCGLDDLILKGKTNKWRKENLQTSMKYTVDQICKTYGARKVEDVYFIGRSAFKCDENGQHIEEENKIHVDKDEEIVEIIKSKIQAQPNFTEQLDAEYKHHMTNHLSQINNHCLMGFIKQFPKNNFSMMTVTGAKGSNVNHSQVSVMLGQQELQGRRVPIMISGKTLPSFYAYDPNPRASGFISDRFLTGLRQQQFFFHCMAGREGLIDTAVKTSRSGYLQRCLMKHLQSLKVEYDYTVRDADGSIIQFLYGEDSLDPTKQKFIPKLNFMDDNYSTFKTKYQHQYFKKMMKTKEIFQFKQSKASQDSILQIYRPGANVGTISDKCYESLKKHNKNKEFNEVVALKYMHNTINPGQSVGCTAAQSIGQPSTQMTLNTFHLAGHGGVNLTLGIPRLRQLLMTSSDKIKTPIMQLYFKKMVTKDQATNYAKRFQKVNLSQLIKSIQVEQWKQLIIGKLLPHSQRKRHYRITLNYENQLIIEKQFDINYEKIKQKVQNHLIEAILSHINRVKKKSQMRQQIKRVKTAEKLQDEQQEDKQKKEIQEVEEKQSIKKAKKKIEEEKQNKEEKVKFDSVYYSAHTFNKNNCIIEVKVPLSMKKFLMTQVVEKLLKSAIMRQVPGINSAIVLETKKSVPYIQTEGVNFNIMKDLDLINMSTIGSNDIQAINKYLGIQAARNAMIKEIVNLFGAYGVTVDYRHLYLIGDYVTFLGKVKAMNRIWIANSASPFQRMSFETSIKFITNAAMFREVDSCSTPSSSIILGQCPKLGTGVFDLFSEPTF